MDAGPGRPPPSRHPATNRGGNRERGRVDRESRAVALLGGALNSTGDAFFLLDRATTVLAANGWAARSGGREPASPVGAALAELLPPAMMTTIRPELDAVFSSGAPHSFDVRAPGDGQWFAGHAYPSGDHLLLHLHDVTERRNAEEVLTLLADAGHAFSVAFDESALAKALATLTVPRLSDWCLVVVPHRGREATREAVARDDAVRDRLLAAVGDQPPDAGTMALIERALSGRSPLAFSSRDRARHVASASIRDLAEAFAVVPLIGRAEALGAILLGRGSGGPSFGRDDLHLIATIGHRAGLVLQNIRLYDAARRATRLRDEVLAIVAHDLRGPLNTITLGATALASVTDQEVDALPRVARQSIVAAASRMDQLLGDLLSAARLDAGWAPAARQRISVGRLVDECVQGFRFRAEAAGIRLDGRIGGSRDATVAVDAERMVEAIGNLLDNAMKFTPAGGQVLVAVRRNTDRVVLSVSDTGPGIPAELHPRLFDRFWQARRSGRAGAGLGLFIAQRIVEAHGGSITVESAPGRGTSFHVALPLDRDVEARHATRAAER